MARNVGWEALYHIARENIRPTYRKIRRMRTDDWLARVGLERRNIAIDVLSACGFVLVGCAVGVGIGLLVAPRSGDELRRDLNSRLLGRTERAGIVERPTYAS